MLDKSKSKTFEMRDIYLLRTSLGNQVLKILDFEDIMPDEGLTWAMYEDR